MGKNPYKLSDGFKTLQNFTSRDSNMQTSRRGFNESSVMTKDSSFFNSDKIFKIGRRKNNSVFAGSTQSQFQVDSSFKYNPASIYDQDAKQIFKQ